MGQHPVVRQAVVQTPVKGVHLENALAGVGPLVKQVVVHIAGGGAVGVHAPLPRENAGERGAVGGLQLHGYTGLEQGVPPNHHLALFVDLRLIQGV